MYEPTFFATLLSNKDKIDTYKGIRFHRVIDNLVMELSIEDLWIQLNYHLIHIDRFFRLLRIGRPTNQIRSFKSVFNSLNFRSNESTTGKDCISNPFTRIQASCTRDSFNG